MDDSLNCANVRAANLKIIYFITDFGISDVSLIIIISDEKTSSSFLKKKKWNYKKTVSIYLCRVHNKCIVHRRRDVWSLGFFTMKSATNDIIENFPARNTIIRWRIRFLKISCLLFTVRTFSTYQWKCFFFKRKKKYPTYSTLWVDHCCRQSVWRIALVRAVPRWFNLCVRSKNDSESNSVIQWGCLVGCLLFLYSR